MPDLAFYNAGCSGSRGIRQIVVVARRLLRRVLRPIFLHQVALFQYLIERLDRDEASLTGVQSDVATLTRRQDEIDQRLETVQAFGWDYVAMVRRLAVIEDQLAALTGQAAPGSDDAETQPSILFPGFDPAAEGRSKVC